MNKEIIYELYAYYPGEAFHTLWLCKTKETAEFLLAWEQASLYNNYLDSKTLFGNITWERYTNQCAPEFKIKEVEVYE